MNTFKIALTLLLMTCGQGICQTSFWKPATIPGTPEVTGDTASVNLGLTFSSDVAGSVTGVRFYKGPHNTGTHVGNLWSSTGAKLAQVTFTGETASGWQQANFASPVSITANTTYTISYLAPNGYYADDQKYAWSTLTATPLHVSGSSPGVYNYGTSALCPTLSWNMSNYWVDTVFVPASQPSPSGQSTTIWPNSTLPGTLEVTSDTSSLTVGLKFYADVAGSVTGVRFYKGPHNTGTHVGTLWSNTGSKLAEIQFSGETASGWQQANFTSPVAIAASTPYVISYLAPKGNYADNQNYSWSTLNATPLHVSGTAPGVYAYGSNTAFPNSSWNVSNYWVDLVFVAGTSSAPPSTLLGISGQVSGSTAATVTLSGAATGSTTTDATGKYSFSGLANGSYIVAPSQAGYTFTPSTAIATISGAAVTGVNFTATAVSVPVSHSVSLTWTPSTSSTVVGYNVYRATTSGGPYAKVNGSSVAATTYSDGSVASGQTYYYVATAVDSSNLESAYSTQAKSVVPTP
jgi:hypothetical protein